MTGRRQSGAVALEAVLVLPLVALVLAALLSAMAVVGDQLAVTQAARAAARTVAVTGDPGRATVVAARATPGARTTVDVERGVVTVTVTVAADLLGVGYRVHATAAAPLEPVTRRPPQPR